MKHVILGLTLLAASAGAMAAANPVEQARADCAANKMKVRALEGRMAPDKDISAARKTWEASCVRAQQLMMTTSAEPAVIAPAPQAPVVAPKATPVAPAAATACVHAAPEAPAEPAPQAPPAS